MQKITPFLMFNDQLHDAVTFYVSVFKGSKIVDARRGADGKMMSATFDLEGQRIMAFNGGPHFSFSQGMSLFVSCDTQAEVDELWEKLSEGGKVQRCGWLQDRFGVSWQIVPNVLGRYLSDPDPAKSARVMKAMLAMVKLDIAGLTEAYERG